MIHQAIRGLVAIGVIASMAACAGASGGYAPRTPGVVAAQSTSVAFKVTIPRAPASGTLRPAYVSASTQSISVTAAPSGGAAGSPVVVNCTTTCSGAIDAPLGSDTFVVSLYNAQNAGGSALAIGSATQTVLAGQTNQVNVTCGGVVASMTVTFGAGLTVGTPATIPLIVNALDASGNIIIAPGSYVDAAGNPVNLIAADFDVSGATSISYVGNITGPMTGITMHYDGSAILPVVAYGFGTTHGTASPTVTQNFAYTGADQTFTVPTGVAVLNVQVRGAAGGSGALVLSPFAGTQPSGGQGGNTQALLPVTAGGTFKVIVGGQGSTDVANNGGGGGYGGGGAGANSQSEDGNETELQGGGGGGASGIQDATSSWLLVAGGGGGNGEYGNDTQGLGFGIGFDAGIGGRGGAPGSSPGAVGGVSGTNTGGGQNGNGAGSASPGAGAPWACIDASLAVVTSGNAPSGNGSSGGRGIGVSRLYAPFTCLNASAGGGGGGGYYGGGGGGGILAMAANLLPVSPSDEHTGAGGGGSYVIAGATNVAMTAGGNAGNGSVAISW